jgi:hypothetical protein
MHISYVETTNEVETTHNQLLALFMRASPLLHALTKQKDEDYSRRLAEYFDSSANAHWAVLFPKSRKVVKEPSIAEAAEFKKISTNLANLSRQVQSIGSRLSSVPTAAKATYAAAAATAKPAPKTNLPSHKPLPPKTNTPRPRLVINLGPNCRYSWKPPNALLKELNDGLAKLGHTVRLSEVHRTTKGNLVVTAAPEISAEQLASVTTALATIVAPFSEHPASVYRDVKWSKLLLHNVWTGKTDRVPAHSPDEIHRELIAHNPVYRELTITQKPSWVKNPEKFTSARSSVCFAFEDPDGKICSTLSRSHKVLYLFGDRSPIKSWLKSKELRRAEIRKKKKTNDIPATGANMTEIPSGKLEPSTTSPIAAPPFPSLPQKPTILPTTLRASSKEPPGSALEVGAAPMVMALEKLEARAKKITLSTRPNTPQSQDNEMIIDDGEADDDEYTTEEEFIEGHSQSPRRGTKYFYRS